MPSDQKPSATRGGSRDSASHPAAYSAGSDAPTILEQIFVPFANQKYQAELGAYLHATGQVSDQAKKTVNAVIIVAGICLALVMITSTISIIRIFTGHDPGIQKIDAEMERIRKQAAIEAEKFEEEQRKLDEEYRRQRAEEERRQAQEEAQQAEELRRSQEEFNQRVQESQREMMDNYRNYRGSRPSNVSQNAV